VTGLMGANCRHFFDAYYPGITQLQTVPKEVNGMTSAEYYEATQRQRELERRVRATKREVVALEQGKLGLGDPKYVQKRLVLGRQQGELAAWCDKYGLPRQYAREKAYGIGAQPQALGMAFKSATFPDIEIGKSVGAKLMTDPVYVVYDAGNGKTALARIGELVEGTSILDIKPIAGGRYGRIDDIDRICDRYDGVPSDWMKWKGVGQVKLDEDDSIIVTELHWLEKDGERHEVKIPYDR